MWRPLICVQSRKVDFNLRNECMLTKRRMRILCQTCWHFSNNPSSSGQSELSTRCRQEVFPDPPFTVIPRATNTQAHKCLHAHKLPMPPNSHPLTMASGTMPPRSCGARRMRVCTSLVAVRVSGYSTCHVTSLPPWVTISPFTSRSTCSTRW